LGKRPNLFDAFNFALAQLFLCAAPLTC
jgi:hypothetical protein